MATAMSVKVIIINPYFIYKSLVFKVALKAIKRTAHSIKYFYIFRFFILKGASDRRLGASWMRGPAVSGLVEKFKSDLGASANIVKVSIGLYPVKIKCESWPMGKHPRFHHLLLRQNRST